MRSVNRGYNDAQYKEMSRTYSVAQCLRLQGGISVASCMLYSCQSGLDWEARGCRLIQVTAIAFIRSQGNS